MKRPNSFEFAMDFLGEPEASELLKYVEVLEDKVAIECEHCPVFEERDQLQARVAELEETLLQEYSTHPHTCDLWHDLKNGICNCDAQAATEVLGRSASQSLARRDARVKAEALRNEAKRLMPGPCNPPDDQPADYQVLCEILAEIRDQADRMESEAEGKDDETV